MYVIEYLDAIVTSYGSFTSQELAQDWINTHVDDEEARRYRPIEIPANPYGFARVEASDAATAPANVYVRRGSASIPVKA